MAKSQRTRNTEQTDNAVLQIETAALPAENGTAVNPETTETAEIVRINEVSGIQINDPMDVLNSKRFTKGAISYLSPVELLQPCIEVLGKTNGVLTLQGGAEVTNENLDKTKNTSYGRLNLVSKYSLDNELSYEIGILAAYDLGQPKLKIYRGAKVSACMNLCIFQAEDTVKFDIQEGYNMELIQRFIEGLSAKMQESIDIVNRLKAMPIPENIVSEVLGKMLVKTVQEKKVSGTTPILSAANLLTDAKSKYYFKQPGFNAWHLFNSFTENMSKLNFFDIPEKTRDIYSLLREICLS